MLSIVEATIPKDRTIIRDLFAEHLQWVCRKLAEEYGVVVDAGSILVHDLKNLAAFLPPRGFILLSLAERAVAGCTCVRTINDGVAELKRMYVRPSFRRKGIGAALLQEAICRVRQSGYSTILLDSARFMTDAHRLYRSWGFRDIKPYEGTDVPKERQKDCVFMQLDLIAGEGKAT